MTLASLQTLLKQIAAGEKSVDDGIATLQTLPFAEGRQVLTDTHRLVRQGFPEAVFAEGKTAEQTLSAITTLINSQGCALATRVDPTTAAALTAVHPAGLYHPLARVWRFGSLPSRNRSSTLVCAGTSDLPAADEAAETLTFSGVTVHRITDVGVAGLHRLLARLDDLRAAEVLIVAAGMEGALPGVIGGLVATPVIALPTSVGYGANFGGLSALLTMLNACASGITVVNIDNGYGAAIAALRILGHPSP